LRAPGAYTVPGMSQVPDLATLQQTGKVIASNLSTAAVSGKGTDPTLITPKPTNITQQPTSPQTYFV